MTVRGELTLLGSFASVRDIKIPPSISSLMLKSSWLTNWTRTQAGSLFYEAVEIRHLLIQRTEGGVFALLSFSSESFMIFRVLAEAIDTKLRNLGWSVSSE